MTYQQLTLEERSILYGLCKAGFSQTKIAKELNRSKSTISRELKRNSGKRGYRPKQANEVASIRKHESYKAIKFTSCLRGKIELLLKEKWSPEQISNRLKLEGINISHQRIYDHIAKDKADGGILYKNLRQGNKKRRKKYGKNASKRGQIQNRVSIKERPDDIESRTKYGHWEGDTIIGKNHKKAMVTLIERKGGFSIIKKVNSKNAINVANEIIKIIKQSKQIVKSITFDNGLEFAEHEKISQSLGCKIYFADPYSSYQRGTNENTNGLIRQYFPKGSDFDNYTERDVNRVMNSLNNRPRKRLGFKTPYEIHLQESVALNN